MRSAHSLSPPLLLVAHGTRAPAGPREIDRIAEAAAGRLGVDVHVAYVDVVAPTVGDVLSSIKERVVVLPAFLASGYHVRRDLPAQIAATGHEVFLADALGPADGIADAMYQRLVAAGWRRGDRVLFSAAGSSDPSALAEVRVAAALLGRRCGRWLTPSYVTTAAPLTSEICGGAGRTFVAPYLLAPGLFHSRLAALPVTATAEPIGAHPSVVDLVTLRYRHARGTSSRVA